MQSNADIMKLIIVFGRYEAYIRTSYSIHLVMYGEYCLYAPPIVCRLLIISTS